MANDTTANDLKEDVLSRCGEVTDGTSEFDATALSYINDLYQSIICGASEFDLDLGEPWPWAFAQKEIILTLLPPIGSSFSSISINLTQGSASGSFSTAPQINGSNISVQNWWVQTTASSEWYQIISHTSGQTNFTLDTTFNDTSVTSATFLGIKLDYTLTAINTSNSEPAGIQRLADGFEVYRQQDFSNDNEYKIYHCDIREFKRQYPLSVIELGLPTRFCVTSQRDGVFNIRFNKYTDIMSRVNIPYIPVPLDLTSNPDSVPILPREHRIALVYGACYWLMTDKSDDRAEKYLALVQAKLKALVQDARKKRNHIDKNKAVIMPRWDQVNQRKRILYF